MAFSIEWKFRRLSAIDLYRNWSFEFAGRLERNWIAPKGSMPCRSLEMRGSRATGIGPVRLGIGLHSSGSRSAAGYQIPRLPSGLVRALTSTGSLSPCWFLERTSTSYSVAGFNPTNPHPVRGVSKPILHSLVSTSLIRTTYVIGGAHSASIPSPASPPTLLSTIEKIPVLPSQDTGGLSCRAVDQLR